MPRPCPGFVRVEGERHLGRGTTSHQATPSPLQIMHPHMSTTEKTHPYLGSGRIIFAPADRSIGTFFACSLLQRALASSSTLRNSPGSSSAPSPTGAKVPAAFPLPTRHLVVPIAASNAAITVRMGRLPYWISASHPQPSRNSCYHSTVPRPDPPLCAAVLSWGGAFRPDGPASLIVAGSTGEDRLEIRLFASL